MLLNINNKNRLIKNLFTFGLVISLIIVIPAQISLVKADTSYYECNLESLWRHECVWAPDTTNNQIGASFNMHFVSDVVVGSTHYYYYIKYINDKPGVGLATSSDGVNMTDQGLVLAPGSGNDANFASFPGIFYENGVFYMFYEGSGNQYGSAIYLATSTNGTSFTKYSETPRLRSTANAWDSSGVGTPSIVKKDSTYYLFYHGCNGTDDQNGVATSSSLYGPFTKSFSNPIVPCGATGSYDCGTVGKRDIVYYNGLYYMVYEASTDGVNNDFSNAQWTLGLARSADLINWYKYDLNPILPVHQGFGNDGPDFVEIDGTLWIYYRTSEPSLATARIKLVNEVTGGLNLSWEAENLYHLIGRADGDGWSANCTQDSSSYLVYGPYATTVPAGNVNAVFKMQIDNNSADNLNVVRIEVFDSTTQTILASRNISRNQFIHTFHYEFFTLAFNNPYSGHSLELRTYWNDYAYIKQDKSGVVWTS